MKKLLLLKAIFFIAVLSNYAQNDPIHQTISVQDADALIKTYKDSSNFYIMDVRTPGEFDSGYIEGAVNQNYYGAGFDDTLAVLDKNLVYLVYCASGGRSAGAFSKMIAAGFQTVYNMQGGINAWKGAGYPVVTGGTGIDIFADRPAVVRIYPNPLTSDSKFILLDGAGEHVKVKVLSMTGQTVDVFELWPGDYYIPDINNLVDGIYFFQVYLNNEIIQTERFIKNR